MQLPEGPATAGRICIPNIGVRGSERRLRGGLIWLVAGMTLTVACILWSLPPAVFVLLYGINLLAALGYLQAREKT